MYCVGGKLEVQEEGDKDDKKGLDNYILGFGVCVTSEIVRFRHYFIWTHAKKIISIHRCSIPWNVEC